MNPRVSICLPNLNHRRFLEERMETILAQTFTDWELIVCDSYSDDGSWEYFQKFKDDPRIRLYQVPREGLYAGWNECLRRVRGEYIYIATSDDTMMPTCLEQLVAPLEDCPDLSLSVCDFDRIDECGHILKPNRPGWGFFSDDFFVGQTVRTGLREFILTAIFGTLWVTMTSVLFRRALLGRTGLFRTDLGSRADEEWTLRACLASDIAYAGKPLATWRIHSGQATGAWRSKRLGDYWFHKSLYNVIRDPDSGIPSEWRANSELMEGLIAIRRSVLYGSFRISRWDLKEAPGVALRDLWSALQMVPEYVMSQIRSGFSLYQPHGLHQEDLHRQALRMMELADRTLAREG
jgi:glycosyltransferase involved in cell wall biosynthesis